MAIVESPGPRHSLKLPEGRPLAIAHRFGNDLARVQEAVDAGADMIEVDAWLHRGHLDARHEKTLGDLPIRWDKWKLEWARSPRLPMGDLLRTIPNDVILMVDLKGRDRRLPATVLRAIAETNDAQPFAVCARRVELLDGFASSSALGTFPSVATELHVQRLEARRPRPYWAGISAHFELLSPRMMERLRAIAPLIISWPINGSPRLERAIELGVDGVITDEADIVREVRSLRRT